MKKGLFRTVFLSIQTLVLIILAVQMFRFALGKADPSTFTYILLAVALVMAFSGAILFKDEKKKDKTE